MDRQILRVAAAALGLCAISACTAWPIRILDERVPQPSQVENTLPETPSPAALGALPTSPLPWTTSKPSADSPSSVSSLAPGPPAAAAPIRRAIASQTIQRPQAPMQTSRPASPTVADSLVQDHRRTLIESDSVPQPPRSVPATRRPRVVRPAGALTQSGQPPELLPRTATRAVPSPVSPAVTLGSRPTPPGAAPQSGFRAGLRRSVRSDAENRNSAR